MKAIEIVRGDTSPTCRFRLKYKGGEIITDKVEEAWLTVKRDCCDSECLIQKKLSDGSIEYSEEDNYYRFKFNPDDTCELAYGTYGYDVAVKMSKEDKRTPKNDGLLIIKKHFTHKNNE